MVADLEGTYRSQWYQYYNQRRNAGTEGQRGSRGTTEKQHRHPESLFTIRWAMARESQIALSGTGQSFDQFMQWWVNPSECSWHVGMRSSIVKTSGGAIHHEIPQLERSQHAKFSRLDLPILNITFQSGITTPGGNNHIDSGVENFIPHGVANFYDFLSLLDQPNQLSDGSPNYVNIFYISPVHGGNGLWLKGFFNDDGTSFTDSADQPYTITSWTSGFTVCDSNPPLNRLRQNFATMGIR